MGDTDGERDGVGAGCSVVSVGRGSVSVGLGVGVGAGADGKATTIKLMTMLPTKNMLISQSTFWLVVLLCFRLAKLFPS